VGLTPDDWAAWRAMEAICDEGRVRLLGVSNITLEQLQSLCDGARIRPTFVQNRCFATLSWDRQVREFCEANGIIYQGFSLLTANRKVLASSALARIAASHRRTIPQVVFRFAIQIGMIPLTGTSNADHMRADLDIFGFQLKQEEIEQIKGLASK
jgi:diketogulonate reductase-like aldo/keto reductase